MKKGLSILLIFALVIPSLILPENVHAETLGDLKKKLAQLEKEMQNAKEEEELTEAQINQTYQNIDSINANINQINTDMVTLTNEINSLNEEIVNKNKEIKDIVNFVQVSNGESAYLEYAFGAQDFTDFIYRVAISEQLTKYNEELIEEYNQMIENNKNKQVELKNTQASLKSKQGDLQKELSKLGSKLSEVQGISIDKEEEIRLQKEAIDLYENQLGCKDHEDIATCGRDTLPPGTAFFRPLISGYVTSGYGNRCVLLPGGWDCSGHNGLDFSTSGYNVPVYSIGTGMVVGITRRSSCGGNMVYIQHNINGQTYTSNTAHLRSISVSIGDRVTKDTVIGIMGGNPVTEWWDACSTGDHVHVSIAYGLYLTDYYDWYTFAASLFDPKSVINSPAVGGYFKDRITKY